MTKFTWRKAGRLFEGDSPDFTHGSHPCIVHYRDDTFIVAFTCRDAEQKSHVFLSYAEVFDGQVALKGEPILALTPGNAGFFDCDGVISGCLLSNKGQYYLYFVGWQNLPEGLWLCDTGRATLDPHRLELKKEFLGPVFGRDRNHPLFAAATAFHIDEAGQWHTWYNSGLKWEKSADGWHHRYGLHHAVSSDGLNWAPEPGMCIPFADKYEYAFGRPSVVRWDNVFLRWFAHRATQKTSTYRIGYAVSHDGSSWDRNDSISGIDVSDKGWDSEMICYPCVFRHKEHKYMLYNGNGYGLTGFGLAVLEEEQ